jgi:hypothetical protein
MAKPVGLQSKLKDNSKKKYREHEEWMVAKKIGRRKQVWVWDLKPLTVITHEGDQSTITETGYGHWEKVSA